MSSARAVYQRLRELLDESSTWTSSDIHRISELYAELDSKRKPSIDYESRIRLLERRLGIRPGSSRPTPIDQPHSTRYSHPNIIDRGDVTYCDDCGESQQN